MPYVQRQVPPAPLTWYFPDFENSSENNMPGLRPQSEFFLGGVIPVGAQPDNCCICTDPLITDVVQIITCRHFHHLTCILTWWQSGAARRGSCPLCREELFEPDPPPAHVFSLQGTPFQPRDRYTNLEAVRAYTDTQDGQARLRGFMDAVEEHALYAALGENVPAGIGRPSFPLTEYGGDDRDREARRTLLEGHPLYQAYMNGQRARTVQRTVQSRRDLLWEEEYEYEDYDEDHDPGHEDEDEDEDLAEDDATSPAASYHWSGTSSEALHPPTRDNNAVRTLGSRRAALIDGTQGTEPSSTLNNASAPQESPRADENSNDDSSPPPGVDDQQSNAPDEEDEEEYLIDYSDDPLQEELDRAEAGRQPPRYDAWDDPNARTVIRYGLMYRRDHNDNWCIREPTAEEEAEEEAARRLNRGNEEMDDEMLPGPEQPARNTSTFAQTSTPKYGRGYGYSNVPGPRS